MPIMERNVALITKDSNGDTVIEHPLTKVQNVEGLREAIQQSIPTVATVQEAELGVDDTKIMSPLKVKQAIAKFAPQYGGGGTTAAPTIANQTEAENGSDNTKMMTPLRVKQAIAKFAPQYGGGTTTAPQIADQVEATQGTNDTKMMTPLKVKQAIESRAVLTSNLASTAEAGYGMDDFKYMSPMKVKQAIEYRAVIRQDKANVTDAEAGTDDTKYMTPLAVKQAIAKFAPATGGGGTNGLSITAGTLILQHVAFNVKRFEATIPCPAGYTREQCKYAVWVEGTDSMSPIETYEVHVNQSTGLIRGGEYIMGNDGWEYQAATVGYLCIAQK